MERNQSIGEGQCVKGKARGGSAVRALAALPEEPGAQV